MIRAQVDAVLALWGERLFYPGIRKHGRPGNDARVGPSGVNYGEQVRARLRALVQRAPEVIVKVTGGGRGMGPIKAHLVYISRHGALEIEDERGQTVQGPEALKDLVEEWRFAGAEIPSKSYRREAFHVMLSVPPDAEPGMVFSVARDLAREEFARNKFAMVLHEPSTDPRSTRAHVHLIVRAQGWDGQRLHPLNADLARWRQGFADRLTERGIVASATRRQVRGELYPVKTRGGNHAQELERNAAIERPSERAEATQVAVLQAWRELVGALSRSEDGQDRELARQALDFVRQTPLVARRQALLQRAPSSLQTTDERSASARAGRDSPDPVRRRDRVRTR